MPEVVEVTYLANELNKTLKGKVIKDAKFGYGRYVKHGHPDGFLNFKQALPLRCISVTNKAKLIVFEFENSNHQFFYILSRLGMTGWWHTEDKNNVLHPSEHRNFVMSFHDFNIVYSDYRNFGTISFTTNKAFVDKELNKLAPDIMNATTTFAIFMDQVDNLTNTQKNKLIEDVLMDQRQIVSGIGNYLKSEVLYDAKISPKRKVKDVSVGEWKTLYESMKIVTKRMYKTTLNDFKGYDEAMKVYHKKKDPHGNEVKKHMSKSGRTTYWVPSIQN